MKLGTIDSIPVAPLAADRHARDHRQGSEAFARLRTMTLVALGLTLVLVALGGAVRATDSGLACPDWPLCYGEVVPRHTDIPEGSGYTLWNVWLEHSHRLVASIVGVLIVALVAQTLRRHRAERLVVVPLVTALVAVLVQATLGALVVLHLLQAELVTAHLGMSLVVIACLVVAAANMSPSRHAERLALAPTDRATGPAMALAGLVLAQVLVGGQVTGEHAGLAYGTSPLRFHGGLLPGGIASTAEAYHLTHRLLAYAVGVAAIAMCVSVVRRRRSSPVSADAPGTDLSVWLAVGLAVLVVAQVVIGFVNIWALSAPPVVTAHLAVASWIWTASVALVVVEARRVPRIGT